MRIPDGFAPHPRKSPLTDPWEPLFSRIDGESFQIGLEVANAHCNARGMPHGGLIAALADNAMGLSYGLALKAKGPNDIKGIVTVSLTLDYLATGKIGDWLVVVPRVLKAGRSTGFVEAHIMSGETMVARASATFRAL